MSVVPGIRMAIGTMTAIPVRGPSQIDRSVARIAMISAAPAALLIAMPAAAIGWALSLIAVPLFGCGVIVVGLVAWLSRGLHLDGLADTADALSASWSSERALEVMKRSDIGPMGVITLVIVLVAQIAAIASILSRPWGAVVVVVAIVVSRMSLAIACHASVPAARPNGLGATVAGVLSTPVSAVVIAVGLILGGVSSLIGGGLWWGGLIAAAVAFGGAAALVLHCVRRLGGITGDVLGASIETLSVLLLVGLSACVG